MNTERPTEFNQGVADADITLANMAERNPVACLERVAAIFNWWVLSGRNPEQDKTLRKLAAKHARRALKNLETVTP